MGGGQQLVFMGQRFGLLNGDVALAGLGTTVLVREAVGGAGLPPPPPADAAGEPARAPAGIACPAGGADEKPQQMALNRCLAAAYGSLPEPQTPIADVEAQISRLRDKGS